MHRRADAKLFQIKHLVLEAFFFQDPKGFTVHHTMHIALADKLVVNSRHHLATLATLGWNRFAPNLLTSAIDVFAIAFVKVPHGFTVYIFSEKDRNAASKQDAHQIPFFAFDGCQAEGLLWSASTTGVRWWSQENQSTLPYHTLHSFDKICRGGWAIVH